MTLGKSIRIYLKEGSVTGIKFAELVNHTIQSLSCPRTKISDLNKHFPLAINTQGIYFLIGFAHDTLQPEVYIGESENVWHRLKNHDLKKDFWNEVIVFTSKDENLTKSHIQYLESRLVEITRIAERYRIINGNSPNLNRLPLPDKDAMEEFLANIKLLTGTLGHKFLENPIANKNVQKPQDIDEDHKNNLVNKDELTLTLNVSGIFANAIQTNEGLVVLENSVVANNPTKNYGYGALRESLIKEGVVSQNKDGILYFSKNHLFSSPSAAAAVILGYSVNGRQLWKNEKGKSIKEIEQNEIK